MISCIALLQKDELAFQQPGCECRMEFGGIGFGIRHQARGRIGRTAPLAGDVMEAESPLEKKERTGFVPDLGMEALRLCTGKDQCEAAAMFGQPGNPAECLLSIGWIQPDAPSQGCAMPSSSLV